MITDLAGERRTAVYAPAEDTAALSRVLRSYHGGKCLEIGFGSGAVLQTLVPNFDLVVGTDLTSVSEASVARGEAEVVLADRATCFMDATFDLVASNPPYLPSDGIGDRTVDGGKGGLEVPMRFLEEALRVIKPDGRIVMLLSDEADLEAFKRTCSERGLTVEEKQKTGVFFEELVVYEIRRGQTLH
jgi:release factor glutamine methyltransferase